MLKFFVADQCTKRHNKISQPACLDVVDKNLHTLPQQACEGDCLTALGAANEFLKKCPPPPPPPTTLPNTKDTHMKKFILNIRIYLDPLD